MSKNGGEIMPRKTIRPEKAIMYITYKEKKEIKRLAQEKGVTISQYLYDIYNKYKEE
jgi:hypothetical protein